MTKDEALRLALEALEYEAQKGSDNAYQSEREAIKAALEAKDEPVAWVYPEFWQHLENLNCGTAYRLSGIGRQPLYTTQPQRKPLTDDEVLRLLSKIDEYAVRLPRGLRDFARAIEAAHGIKGEYETTN